MSNGVLNDFYDQEAAAWDKRLNVAYAKASSRMEKDALDDLAQGPAGLDRVARRHLHAALPRLPGDHGGPHGIRGASSISPPGRRSGWRAG